MVLDALVLLLTHALRRLHRYRIYRLNPHCSVSPCEGAHKVFQGQEQWGKNSVGWHFGFKLHLLVNDQGEWLAFKLMLANTDDRKPVPDITQDLLGKLFGDRGYVSQALFEQLDERGLQLITQSEKKMKTG